MKYLFAGTLVALFTSCYMTAPSEQCIPSCFGKDCGDDGCGGECGSCDNGESCNSDGECEEKGQDSCPQNSHPNGSFCDCDEGYTRVGDGCEQNSSQCPANAHMENGACACDAGFVLSNGACVVDNGGCPAHSHPVGQQCACDAGYVINSTNDGCVLENNNDCPPNSTEHDGDCYCNEGYVPSQDQCVPENSDGSVRGTLKFQYRSPVVAESGAISLGELEEGAAFGLAVLVVDPNGDALGEGMVQNDGTFSVATSRGVQQGDRVHFLTMGFKYNQINVAVVDPGTAGQARQLQADVWNWGMEVPANGDVGTVTIGEEHGSGAVYIFVLAAAALEPMPAASVAEPGLAIAWVPGQAWDCGACYSRTATSLGSTSLPNTIYLPGASNTASAWGYAVILHEIGHYVAATYSVDDSPGGAHSFGQLLDPAFAWSEGWATFFSGMTMSLWTGSAQPFYWDIQSGQSFLIDYSIGGSTMGQLSAPNPSGSQEQDLDEWWVASMIWHVWDGQEIAEPDEGADPVAAGSERVFAAITSARLLQLDRGSGGTDFVDFSDALLCSSPEMVAGYTETLNQYLSFPYDGNFVCN